MSKLRLKKISLFTVIFLIAVLSVFIYGVTVGGEFAFPAWPIMFLVICAVLILIIKITSNGAPKRAVDYLSVILFSVLTVVFCVFFYNTVNQIHSTTVREYDAVVTRDRLIRGILCSTQVYFKDPEGNEKSADLGDYFKIIYTDTEGDTVHVEERNGFFNVLFCTAVIKRE